jgi:hypothetical protein
MGPATNRVPFCSVPQVLLGKRDSAAVNIYSRQILELVSTTTELPLLLSLGLKSDQPSQSALKQILHILNSHSIWRVLSEA